MMVKRAILAIVAVFVAWQAMDFVVHNIMLKDIYFETANLWRPMAEMKMGLMYVVGGITAVCFVLLYAFLVNPKTLMNGLKCGLILGLATGIGAGYGSYSYMPIPYVLAFSWFMSTLVKFVAAGLIVGAIVKE